MRHHYVAVRARHTSGKALLAGLACYTPRKERMEANIHQKFRCAPRLRTSITNWTVVSYLFQQFSEALTHGSTSTRTWSRPLPILSVPPTRKPFPDQNKKRYLPACTHICMEPALPRGDCRRIVCRSWCLARTSLSLVK
jgi:hypothetical protein